MIAGMTFLQIYESSKLCAQLVALGVPLEHLEAVYAHLDGEQAARYAELNKQLEGDL